MKSVITILSSYQTQQGFSVDSVFFKKKQILSKCEWPFRRHRCGLHLQICRDVTDTVVLKHLKQTIWYWSIAKISTINYVLSQKAKDHLKILLSKPYSSFDCVASSAYFSFSDTFKTIKSSPPKTSAVTLLLSPVKICFAQSTKAIYRSLFSIPIRWN